MMRSDHLQEKVGRRLLMAVAVLLCWLPLYAGAETAASSEPAPPASDQQTVETVAEKPEKAANEAMDEAVEAEAESSAAPAPSIDLLGEAVQITGYLLLLVVLAVLAVRFGRKFQPGMGSSRIQLLDGRNLAPGVGVRLVQVGERVWLLGVTKERVDMLAELSEEELPPT